MNMYTDVPCYMVNMRHQTIIFFVCAFCIFIVSGNKEDHRDKHHHEKSHSSHHFLSQHKKSQSRVEPGSQLKDLVCRVGNRRCKFVCIGGNGDDDWDDDDDDTSNIPDKCPVNSSLYKGNFTRREIVYLGPPADSQGKPNWEIRKNGEEIVQTRDCDAGIVLLNDSISSVDFEGTFYVDTEGDDDYFGLVFSYQNNKSFYAVTWKKIAQDYWRDRFLIVAEPGLNIKLINSSTGPGIPLSHALWHSYGITDQTKTLWLDDVKSIPWQPKKSYRWVLNHRPVIGLIRVKILEDNKTIIDSGNVYDDTLLGGRLGVYDYSQAWVSWSNVTYKCNDNVTEEIWQELPPKKRKMLTSFLNRHSNC